MERKDLPMRLSGIQNTLEYVEFELCNIASDLKEEKLTTHTAFEKLLGLSSVLGTAAGQTQDAHYASLLTEEEELGSFWGQAVFPKLMSKKTQAQVNEKKEPQTEDQTT